VVLVSTSLFLFGAAMRGFNHDENLYVAAGVLIASGKVMYKDFAFLQMPLLPVIYAFLFTLFKTTNYLLIGRIFSVTCSILTMFLVLAVFTRAFHHQRLYGILSGISAVILYATNPQIQRVGSRAWNHSLPLLCITLAFFIWTQPDTSKPSRVTPLFLVGFLTGMAVFTRISFVFTALVLFIVLTVAMPASGDVRFRRLLPFLGGAALPALAVVYYLLRAPASFFFDTIQYFFITGAKRWSPDWKAAITFQEKLSMTSDVLTSPSYLILIILFAASCIAAVSMYRHLGERKLPLVLSSSLSAVTIIAAFVITPMQIQYFAAPVPFLLMSIAYAVSVGVSATGKRTPREVVCTAIVALLVLGAVTATFHEKKRSSNIAFAFSEKHWSPTKVYRTSRKVAKMAGADALILTLAPIFALEGGGRIYEEFSTGPFLFRYGAFLSKDQRRIAVCVDSRALQPLLRQRPPDAVFVGFEPLSLDAPLIKYCELSGWHAKEINDFLLYVPPGPR
jgi:hypothetical protein